MLAICKRFRDIKMNMRSCFALLLVLGVSAIAFGQYSTQEVKDEEARAITGGQDVTICNRVTIDAGTSACSTSSDLCPKSNLVASGYNGSSCSQQVYCGCTGYYQGPSCTTAVGE